MCAALGIHVVEHRAAAVPGPVAPVEMAVTYGWHAFDDAESPVDAGLADLVAEDVQLVPAVEVGGDHLAGRPRILARADQATLGDQQARVAGPVHFPRPFVARPPPQR